MIDVASTTYQDFNGYWLPQCMDYSRSDDTGEVQDSSRTEFNWVSVGEALTAETFELSSFPGVTTGIDVYWIMPDERPPPFGADIDMVFDGTNVVPAGGFLIRQNKEPARYRPVWLLWSNGALIFALLLWRLLRRRR